MTDVLADIIRIPATDPLWVVALLLASRLIVFIISAAFVAEMVWRARGVAGSLLKPPWDLSWYWSLTGFLFAFFLGVAAGMGRVLLAGHIRDQTAIGQGMRGFEMFASIHLACWIVLMYRRWRNPELGEIDDVQMGRALNRSHPSVVADLSGVILAANDLFLRLWGGKRSSLIGQSLTTLMPDGYRDAHRVGLRRYAETGVPHIIGTAVPLEMLRANGEVIPIHLVVNRERFGKQECVMGTIHERDLTGDPVPFDREVV